MWQTKVAAVLVSCSSFLGLYMNILLLATLLHRNSNNYGTYMFMLTIGKAVGNINVLIVFLIAEVPNLIAEEDLYPEFVFRACGAVAGTSSVPRCLFHFFISLGTLFTAIWPMRSYPKLLHVLSMMVPISIGIGLFSARISSEDCSYQFSWESFAWFYFQAPCGQALQKIVARIIQTQILGCCIFNFATFMRVLMSFTQKAYLQSSESKARISRTKWRLFQCVAQDVLFILDICVYFNESEKVNIFLNFIFNTYFWNCAHTVDGIIMYAMLNKLKISSKKNSTMVVSTVMISSVNTGQARKNSKVSIASHY